MAVQERQPDQADRLERRSSRRFPIEQVLTYKSLGAKKDAVSGHGRVVNISSGGILFTSEHELRPGSKLEIAVNWPVRHFDGNGVQLFLHARVVRTEPGRAAAAIELHEFRTAEATAAPESRAGRREHPQDPGAPPGNVRSSR